MDERTARPAALRSRRTRLAIRLRTHPLRWIALIMLIGQIPWVIAAAMADSGELIWVLLYGTVALAGATSFHVIRGHQGIVERAAALAFVSVLPCVALIAVLLALEGDLNFVRSALSEIVVYACVPGTAGFLSGWLLRGRSRATTLTRVEHLLLGLGVTVLSLPPTVTRDRNAIAVWALVWSVVGMAAFHLRATNETGRGWAPLATASAVCAVVLVTFGDEHPGLAFVGWMIVAGVGVALLCVARLAASLSVPPPDHILRADHALEIGAMGTRGSRATSGSESMSAREAGPG